MIIKVPNYYREIGAYIRTTLVPVMKIEVDGEYRLTSNDKKPLYETRDIELSYIYFTQEERKYRKALYDFARTHKEVKFRDMIPGKEYLAMIVIAEVCGTLYDPPYERDVDIFYFEYNHKEKYKIFF